MGDEADALIDQVLDFYRLDGEDGGGYYREARCRDCGSTGVYWAKEDDRWVLYGLDSRKHRCDKRKLTRTRMDAFDSLD